MVRKQLSAEVLEEISTMVRAGFYDKQRLLAIFLEEMYAPGELDKTTVTTAIDTATKEWNKEKKTWPTVTDCDRLEKAFAKLRKHGVISLQNAGYTQSDGYDDVQAAYRRHPRKSSVVGYCFYHGQDLERAVRGGGLYLAYGPVDPNDEETEGPKVGHLIREELERVGLNVQWDGTFDTRILMPDFLWQKR
jgi:hypothetical protein